MNCSSTPLQKAAPVVHLSPLTQYIAEHQAAHIHDLILDDHAK